jgi:uncharacterized repeat protein (TIGR03943 family)
MKHLSTRMAARLKALILILTAIFLTQKFASGELYFYIGQRFWWLALLGIMLMIILAGAYRLSGPADAHEHEHEHENKHDHEHSTSIGGLLIVALPLILGVIVPARPLGAGAAGSRGVSTDIAVEAGSESQSLTIIPGERNILDWVMVISETDNPAALNGQEVDVIGFVYRDERFGEEQFLLSRFTITCCVADAVAVGLVVDAEDTADYPVDTWVQVTGTFAEGEIDGQPIPVVIPDEIVPIQPPDQPYLYP